MAATTNEPKQASRKRRRARIDVQPKQVPDAGKTAPRGARSRSMSEGAAAQEPGAAAKPNKAAEKRAKQHGRMSALDSAFAVLSTLSAKEAAEGLSASVLIERMEKARLWTSPGGKTPDATLYAAMMRE